MQDAQSEKQTGIQFYYAADAAPSLEESGMLTFTSGGAVADDGFGAMKQTGYDEGLQTKLLFKSDTMSLIYAWFKSDFPLPLHSHNCDCLYHVVAGSVKVGSRELFAGDGFVVPAGVPYRHRAGADGLELLEFRTTADFDIKMLAKTAKAWSDICDTLVSSGERWRAEPPPSRTN